MYTPNYLKERYGSGFVYEPEPHLIPRYDLLIKYDKLWNLDIMVFEGGMEITRYIQTFSDITKEDRMEEFFSGVSLEMLDILDGDISEITPIIYDRVKLFKNFYKGTVKDIFSRFINSPRLLQSVYEHYFDEEG